MDVSKSPSAGQGWEIDQSIRLKALFQRTLLFSSGMMFFLEALLPTRAVSLMHPEQHGQTRALGAAQCIRGISLRKIFLLQSFVTETGGKCRSWIGADTEAQGNP